MTEIIEQMKFCNQLEKKLTEAVVLHENRRCTLDTPHHCNVAEYGTGIVERGASKTQIMASIVQLRRELNVLSKMFDDWGVAGK
ncbi:MAG: hypothetical protein IKD27_08010 [Oscillospiraceae bacterium]|nr:hypothetical protein [Oscillospiraceae bacterium]